LNGLDDQIERSRSFFAAKPVILDLGLLTPEAEGLSELLSALEVRGVRIIGIEGADASWPALKEWEWPNGFEGGRASGAIDIPEDDNPKTEAPPVASAQTLLVENPVRSGQSIFHPEGDVVIVGSVASGAEVTAGGSIHVYGALRGRAIAGIGGHNDARIFASVMRAELLAIDGFYKTADELGDALPGTAAQALLEGDRIVVRVL